MSNIHCPDCGAMLGHVHKDGCLKLRQVSGVRDTLAAHTDLLTYVLQDEVHNRLTPRVIDIAYTAFMSAKQPNSEDGRGSDWFNDTRPAVRAAIDKLRRELFEDRDALASAPPAPALSEPVAMHEFKVRLTEYGLAMRHGNGEKARVLADVLASMLAIAPTAQGLSDAEIDALCEQAKRQWDEEELYANLKHFAEEVIAASRTTPTQAAQGLTDAEIDALKSVGLSVFDGSRDACDAIEWVCSMLRVKFEDANRAASRTTPTGGAS